VLFFNRFPQVYSSFHNQELPECAYWDSLAPYDRRGTAGWRAQVELHGFNEQLGEDHWYDNVTHGPTKWADRATSSTASTPPRAQGEGPGESGPRWIATGSTVEGQIWAWWDGTKYTGQYQ
jgi:hypothetical protein